MPRGFLAVSLLLLLVSIPADSSGILPSVARMSKTRSGQTGRLSLRGGLLQDSEQQDDDGPGVVEGGEEDIGLEDNGGGGEEEGGEGNDDARRRILGGGDVSFAPGDIFCGDEDGKITVDHALNLTFKSRKKLSSSSSEGILQTRIWASWNLSAISIANFTSLAFCWETKTGFIPTISVAGSLNISYCDVFAGGGPCMECMEGSTVWATRNRIGGFGTGPRPSATVGVMAWGRERRCFVSLVDCRFQHVINHAIRMCKASSGLIDSCSLVNCGKTIMRDAEADVEIR